MLYMFYTFSMDKTKKDDVHGRKIRIVKVTLKEELEILRGEPIQVFTGDPLSIPCIETSDPERLCRHPVVSVNMITYNHEPYIRQAIEGVMMQKTDFEFELVIGEDCSTDRTREICFEYQKRYPDKIRVLWCDHNLYRNPHPAGGNGQRNMAHCRGEFIAFCEGDDYWIDPLKLQKQVDVMRKHPNVGFCFCGARVLNQKREDDFFKDCNQPFMGEVDGQIINYWIISGRKQNEHGSLKLFSSLITPSALVRKTVLERAMKQFPVFFWRMNMGDTTIWLGMGSLSNAFFMSEVQAVYRVHDGGVSNSQGPMPFRVGVDGLLVRIYFLEKNRFCLTNDREDIISGVAKLRISVLSVLDACLVKSDCDQIKRNMITRHLRTECHVFNIRYYVFSTCWLPLAIRKLILRIVLKIVR